MTEKWIDLEIYSIDMDAQADKPCILLTDSRNARILVLPLGPAEASLLIMFLEGLLPAKPLTHDLIVSFWEKHGFTPKQVLIYAKEGDFFSSRIEYGDKNGQYSMEVRASDAVLLSVRAGIPIKACSSLLAQSSRTARADASVMRYKRPGESTQIH
jgi:bifunctional DNase/RNase